MFQAVLIGFESVLQLEHVKAASDEGSQELLVTHPSLHTEDVALAQTGAVAEGMVREIAVEGRELNIAVSQVAHVVHRTAYNERIGHFKINTLNGSIVMRTKHIDDGVKDCIHFLGEEKKGKGYAFSEEVHHSHSEGLVLTETAQELAHGAFGVTPLANVEGALH